MVFDFIKTVNEAKAQVFSTDMFGYEDCQEHQEELTPNMIMNFYTGTICVLTNQGRLSLLQFTWSDLREGKEWVEFDFTTWSEIVTP
jgi:hypothetical protein